MEFQKVKKQVFQFSSVTLPIMTLVIFGIFLGGGFGDMLI